MATITANEQNLNSVFSDAHFFEIPTYQRPYSWEKEQVDELLSDLLDAMERGDDAPYFLGSIVLIKEDDNSKSEVVDGQQRLTTLSMLFCVLREISTDTDAQTLLDGFVREAGNRFRGTQDRFRLNLRRRDQDFFRKNVQIVGSLGQFLEQAKNDYSDVEHRIFENAKHLNDKLRELKEEDRERLAQYITQHCYLVVVATSDKNSAYRIFSVMNDRGLDLSPTDILKADVVGAMSPGDEEREYSDKWEHIEEELGRDGFQNVFGHLRMIYLKDKQRRTLQEEIQDSLLKDVTSEKAKTFVDEILEPYASVYGVVSSASYESSEDAQVINTYLRHLARLDNSDWIPPAMAFFHQNQYSQNALAEFIRDLERLAYGLFIRRADINERIRRYANVIRDIEQDDDLWRVGGSLQLEDDEKTSILNALDGDIYSQTRVRLPLILRLDSALTDAGAHYQHSVISIEHVLPQHPAEKSQWMEWFSDPQERRQWTHKLANLVLLSWRKNTRASNREFDYKKSQYFQRNGGTPFVLTSQVVNETEWTPTVLERRQRALIDALKKEWRLE